MKLPPAPLRFLILVAGGWTALRLVMLVPMSTADAVEGDMAGRPQPATALGRSEPAVSASGAPIAFAAPGPQSAPAVVSRPPAAFGPVVRPLPAARSSMSPVIAVASSPMILGPAEPSPALAPGLFPTAAPARRNAQRAPRLAGSAWLLLRDGGFSLTPGAGTLGASQAGVRLTYRVAGDRAPLAVSLRATAAIDRPQQSEIAVGLDWQPVAALPVHILAERRRRIGREGRSDFSLTAYGGASRRIGPVQVDAYAQAGIVGRDAFADGAVRATHRVGPLDVGAGTWGGAQPGASRVDAGPHVSARIPLAGANLRAAAEWRFRIAGDAMPDSGPAFTLASDF